MLIYPNYLLMLIYFVILHVLDVFYVPGIMLCIREMKMNKT